MSLVLGIIPDNAEMKVRSTCTNASIPSVYPILYTYEWLLGKLYYTHNLDSLRV